MHDEYGSRSREALLEEQVRLLAAGLGLKPGDLVDSIPRDAVRVAREDKTILAIRLLRKAGVGMVSAKRIVDREREPCT
jgi:hypothetical protein